jgi:hypothetical protein
MSADLKADSGLLITVIVACILFHAVCWRRYIVGAVTQHFGHEVQSHADALKQWRGLAPDLRSTFEAFFWLYYISLILPFIIVSFGGASLPIFSSLKIFKDVPDEAYSITSAVLLYVSTLGTGAAAGREGGNALFDKFDGPLRGFWLQRAEAAVSASAAGGGHSSWRFVRQYYFVCFLLSAGLITASFIASVYLVEQDALQRGPPLAVSAGPSPAQANDPANGSTDGSASPLKVPELLDNPVGYVASHLSLFPMVISKAFRDPMDLFSSFMLQTIFPVFFCFVLVWYCYMQEHIRVSEEGERAEARKLPHQNGPMFLWCFLLSLAARIMLDVGIAVGRGKAVVLFTDMGLSLYCIYMLNHLIYILFFSVLLWTIWPPPATAAPAPVPTGYARAKRGLARISGIAAIAVLITAAGGLMAASGQFLGQRSEALNAWVQAQRARVDLQAVTEDATIVGELKRLGLYPYFDVLRTLTEQEVQAVGAMTMRGNWIDKDAVQQARKRYERSEDFGRTYQGHARPGHQCLVPALTVHTTLALPVDAADQVSAFRRQGIGLLVDDSFGVYVHAQCLSDVHFPDAQGFLFELVYLKLKKMVEARHLHAIDESMLKKLESIGGGGVDTISDGDPCSVYVSDLSSVCKSPGACGDRTVAERRFLAAVCRLQHNIVDRKLAANGYVRLSRIQNNSATAAMAIGGAMMILLVGAIVAVVAWLSARQMGRAAA